MPSILFLTYYFPPCNATGANRPGSFTRNLVKNGFQVTVVTRQWSGNEKSWNDQLADNPDPLKIETSENLDVHYLPYRAFNYYSAGIFHTIIENLKGNFNYELNYGQFTGYIRQLLRQTTYDYILTSAPPLTVLKTAALLSGEFKIPLIADFRDFENDIVLYKEKKHSWLRSWQHALLMKKMRKWMKQARISFTASPPLSEYLSTHFRQQVFTLNNGFNLELLQVNEKIHTEAFHITVTGSLWEMANLPVMVEACKLLYERNPGINIRFNFIGLLINENVARMFREVIPEENLRITHRVPQEEALKIASSSHILMLAGFDEMKGAYTTKIFEYLGLRRNIIQIPGDKDVVEELIHRTGSGKTPHSAEEACQDFLDWYEEWKRTGALEYKGDMEKIMEFSREKQFEKLLIKIK